MAEIKTKLLFDGYSQYRSELANITQQTKTLAAEMKAVTSSFDSSTSAQEKNRSSRESLTKQIEAQEEVIKKLEDGIKRATDAGHGNETQTLRMKEQLANAKTTLNSLSEEYNNVGKSTNQAKEATSSFADVLKANLASEAIVAGVKAIGSAISAIGKGLFSLGKESVSAYADFEQLEGGIKKIFGDDDFQKVAENAANAYKTVGISANEYMESVTGFSASLINSLGGDTAQAAALADQALRDISDNANTYGKYTVEELTNVYQNLAKGQYQTLDNLQLGFKGSKEGMQDLIDAANEYNKQQGKDTNYQLENYADIINAIHDIQEQQGIMGTTEKEASKTITGSINAMKGAWQNLLAGFANPDADIEGLGRKLIATFSNVVKNLTPAISQILKSLPMLFEELAPAFQALVPQLLAQIEPMIPMIVDGIVSMIPILLPVALEIINALSAALVEHAPELLKAAGQLLLGLAQAFIQLAPTLIVSGFTLISQLADGLWQGLLDLMNKFGGWLETVFQPVKDWANNMISIGWDLVRGLWQGIKDKAAWLKQMISGWVGDVKTFIKNLFGVASPSKYTTWIGEMLGEGLANGIIGSKKLVNNAWQNSFGLPAFSTNVSAAAPKVVNLTINSTTLTDAQTDYLINRINAEFGSAV